VTTHLRLVEERLRILGDFERRRRANNDKSGYPSNGAEGSAVKQNRTKIKIIGGVRQKGDTWKSKITVVVDSQNKSSKRYENGLDIKRFRV